MHNFLWDVGPLLTLSHLQAATHNTSHQPPFSLMLKCPFTAYEAENSCLRETRSLELATGGLQK